MEEKDSLASELLHFSYDYAGQLSRKVNKKILKVL